MQINSSNEYSPLKECIVGSVLNHSFNTSDPTFQMVHYGNLKDSTFTKSERYRIDKKRHKERAEDLDNLAKVLEEHGVKVWRPDDMTTVRNLTTPHFTAIMTAPDQPRDTMLVVNNLLIDTPPTVRGRYFENLHYRDILKHITSGVHVSAPMSMMDDESILFESADEKGGYVLRGRENIPHRLEMAFDAANIVKISPFAILMNIGTPAAELGYWWLKELLPNMEVIPVHITDDHIDGAIMPIGRNTMLYNPGLHTEESLKALLPSRMRNWKFLATQDEDWPDDYTEDDIAVASEQCMALNVLSISETKLLIPDAAVNTIKMLEENGFEPIPIPFRHSRLFGGGIHCSTLDIHREIKDWNFTQSI